MKATLCIVFTLIIATVLSVPPQANMLFPQLVGELNYPVETHYIQTADGYINTYFRIQAKNTTIQSGKPVVYFQHGLLDSGDSCVMNNESLAPGLILANHGYDVWVGNTRGNRYSLGHVQWNSSDPNSTYWDFSWQDMSMYDIPAAFAYINNQTGQMINYIGHSQGTSVMFAALARQDQSIIQYLRRFIALGPVAYVDHSTSEVIHLTADSELGKWLNLINLKEFLFLSQDQRDFLEENCEYLDDICLDVVKSIADYEPDVDNVKMMDVFVGHFPAGTSIQNMNYWNQMALNTQFQWYNYGAEGNLQHYNQQTPPYYNLSAINVPVHLYSGIYDELADPTDVAHLNASLTGSPNVTWNTYPLGHLSFLIGINTSYIYDVIDAIDWVSDVEIDI